MATTLNALPVRPGLSRISQASCSNKRGVPVRALSPRCTVAFLAASAARTTRFAAAGPATSTARQGVWYKRPPSAVQSNNRGEDDGGTTQITALLVLSLMLLSLPWALEHPGVLLVPVVMSALPGVGPGFVQPVFRQALVWILDCCKWLPRLAKAAITRQKPAQPVYRQRRSAAGPMPSVNPGQGQRPAAPSAAAAPRVHHAAQRHASQPANILENLDQL